MPLLPRKKRRPMKLLPRKKRRPKKLLPRKKRRPMPLLPRRKRKLRPVLLLNNNIDITITIKLWTLVTKVLSKKSTDSHPTTNQFFHNHGEEQRRHTQRMDSKTHHGNGLLNKSTITIIITKLRTLVMKVLMNQSTDLHHLTNQFFHNHGEEQRKHTQSMDSKTHPGNGSISQSLKKHWPKNTIDIIITTKLRILVMKVSMKRSTDSHLLTNQFSHNHGEEQRKLTQRMDSKTHLGNGLMLRH